MMALQCRKYRESPLASNVPCINISAKHFIFWSRSLLWSQRNGISQLPKLVLSKSACSCLQTSRHRCCRLCAILDEAATALSAEGWPTSCLIYLTKHGDSESVVIRRQPQGPATMSRIRTLPVSSSRSDSWVGKAALISCGIWSYAGLTPRGSIEAPGPQKNASPFPARTRVQSALLLQCEL